MALPPRVLLLIPTTSYKAADFMGAAARLGVEVVVGTDRRQALEREHPGFTLALDWVRWRTALETIRDAHRRRPFAAVLGVDDETVDLAARASLALGLRSNPPEAVRAARDKLETRRRLAAAGRRAPRFRPLALDADPRIEARRSDFPCVIKPTGLSAGRGVIRADDPEAFVAAFERILAILDDPETDRLRGPTRELIVEDYLPGEEFALEGLLVAGRLRTLALFDKPDPLTGPYFEETLYVTPSRKPAAVTDSLRIEAAAGCRALGLVDGPVHVELRHDGERPTLLEVAPRTIGGLCSRTLRFGTGSTLEEVVLRHALGLPLDGLERERGAAGVMMIPIPRAGRFEGIDGLEAAGAEPGIREVALTVHRGDLLRPLPEGHRYLGFLFAEGDDPDAVEASLRRAHRHLAIRWSEPA